MTGKTVFAVIPARGGSRGVLKKNISAVAGKPLVAWTIQAALKSGALNRVVVTTDDPAIAEISKEYGAEVPFLRPEALARDDTPGIDPIIHAVRWLEENEGYDPASVMALQPTSPLRSTKDIDRSVSIMREKGADFVVSVTETKHHPYWTKTIDQNGRLGDFVSSKEIISCRQGLPPAYSINGAIYLGKKKALLEKATWFTDNTYPYIMPQDRSLDIDTPWDIYIADLVLRNAHENK
ncbi:MAG: acylneuraminate cytidylyltransferase family protein [Deltaproteobacteria bacterium]|uniref:Acylneuraminate cytidylyltransferase family protein n=1 Tax=Candidatus Zymogenus saltonus TaxID=2844893 RepID=A0A9D8PPB4_9DELT|nr:acylneuraminate cytidylyltransferase family protein [Candidatus Zymogenus saltonus]